MKHLLIFSICFLFFLGVKAQGSGCPSVSASNDVTISCSATTTTVSATTFPVGETDSYVVNAIPHAPPISYSSPGGTGVSVNTDDVWSSIIQLPFPFCYFGQTYNSCVIGSNGGISFNVSNAGGYHPWPFSASVPSPSLVDAGNIFGPYHDIDPSEGGSIKWYLLGQAPCRTFIVSYNNIPHYDCTSKRSTHMIVLYETTNIIEVYVNNKSTCSGWNSGNTVIGIQNDNGTLGYTPPNRNTGSWTVNTPEAWQFKPDGAPIYSTVQWYNGSTFVGAGDVITVNPTPPQTTYTAQVTYTRCDGLQIVEEDEVIVTYDSVEVSASPSTSFNCAGANTTLNAISTTATDYLWTPGNLTGASVDVSPSTTTTYTVVASNAANGCTDTAYATINVAQPMNVSCNVLYVTPTGSSNGTGTKSDPMDLASALEAGACNGTIVKMAIGDYITDTVINKVTSYITLEGGFDPTLNWDKISTAGGTRILRTATQSYSTVSSPIVNVGNGIVNESGLNPEVVAISINNQSGFRFQDLTIESEVTNAGTQHAGYEGVDVVGVRLNSCDSYDIVRTQVIANDASPGADLIYSIPATNGGNSTGLELIANGANGNIVQSFISAGNGGVGGLGGGVAGTSNNISSSGTSLSTNDSNFDLVNQTTIQMNDIPCTASEIFFNSSNSNTWGFGIGSTPNNATGTTASTLYSTLGRKDITFSGNNYIGFNNIISDSQTLPDFTIHAPFIDGNYRICKGDSFSLEINNGGVGYLYHYTITDTLNNTTNSYTTTSSSTGNITIDTPGVYQFELRFETNCCGISAPTIGYIIVEDIPVAVLPSDPSVCYGDLYGVPITIGGMLDGGTIEWQPNYGLSAVDTSTVIALPISTITYSITLKDSSGLCATTENLTVNVTDLQLTGSSTDANCSVLGSATVNVSGGSGNYSYNWENSSSNANTINNLQPGIYSVVVTDVDLGCSDSIDVVVNPAPGAFTGSITNTNIYCAGGNNGVVSVTVSGGTPPYTYNWAGYPSGTPTTNTTSTLTNLGVGLYNVTVEDATGCTYTDGAIITEQSSINMVVDTAGKPSCLGVDDGFTEIRVSGGTRPYTYSWTNGMLVNIVNDVVVQENLGSDLYTLVVIDDNGCTDSVSVNLYANILEVTQDTSVCFGTTYNLLNGDVITVISDTSIIDTITTPMGCESVVTTNITLLSGAIGVIDSTVCFGESIIVNGNVYDTTTVGAIEIFSNGNPLICDSVVTINLEVIPPPSISATANPDTVIFGDFSTLEAFGNGNFEWDSIHVGASYQVNPIIPTSYNVVLIDSNGCVNQTSVTVYVTDTAQLFVMFPSAFSPNDDGLNDRFRVVSNQEFNEIDMSIYNRWGEKVYIEKGNQNIGWDGNFKGEKQAVDTYIYKVKLITLEDEILTYTGTVALIR